VLQPNQATLLVVLVLVLLPLLVVVVVWVKAAICCSNGFMQVGYQVNYLCLNVDSFAVDILSDDQDWSDEAPYGTTKHTDT
jgi:hypothetical protein